MKINVGKFQSVKTKVGLWLFIIPYFLIIGLMAFFIAKGTPNKEDYDPVEATVIDFVEIPPVDSEDTTSYKTTFYYEYQGTPYTATINSYSSSWKRNDVVTLYVDPLNPSEPQDIDSFYTVYLFLAGFALAGVAFVLLTRGRKKKRASDVNIHIEDEHNDNPLDSEKYSTNEKLDDKYYKNIEYIDENSSESSGELVKTLYFTYDKRIPQGHIFENDNKEVEYEIKSTNFHMLLPISYSFNNLKKGTSNVHKITNQSKSYVGSGDVMTQLNTRYTIDGVDIWDFLRSRDLSFKVKPTDILKPVYYIYKSGELIAKATSTGTNLHGDSKNILSNIPSPGFYKVELNPNYMELIAIMMMLITRNAQN